MDQQHIYEKNNILWSVPIEVYIRLKLIPLSMQTPVMCLPSIMDGDVDSSYNSLHLK